MKMYVVCIGQEDEYARPLGASPVVMAVEQQETGPSFALNLDDCSDSNCSLLYPHASAYSHPCFHCNSMSTHPMYTVVLVSIYS
jgi:hypothetical protein